jgi:hypothetical protein
MTLKEYSESISKLAEKYPDALVVYSSDDEGNSFQKVSSGGTLGFFDGDYYGDFSALQHIQNYVETYPESDTFKQYFGKEPNAVCIN